MCGGVRAGVGEGVYDGMSIRRGASVCCLSVCAGGVSLPPPACPDLAVLWVTAGGVTGYAQRQLDVRFHSRLGGDGRQAQAAIRRPRAAEPRARLAFSRCRVPPCWAGRCVVAVIPRAPRGRPIYGRDRCDRRGVPVDITRLPGTKALCYTFVLAVRNSDAWLHREPGKRGGHRIDLVSAKPLHALGAMGLLQVKPEGGEGEA